MNHAITADRQYLTQNDIVSDMTIVQQQQQHDTSVVDSNRNNRKSTVSGTHFMQYIQHKPDQQQLQPNEHHSGPVTQTHLQAAMQPENEAQVIVTNKVSLIVVFICGH